MRTSSPKSAEKDTGLIYWATVDDITIDEESRTTACTEFDTAAADNYYDNNRFEELPSEVTCESIVSDATLLAAANVLSNDLNRTLAIAIESSGGLLVSGIAKQLPRERSAEAEDAKIS